MHVPLAALRRLPGYCVRPGGGCCFGKMISVHRVSSALPCRTRAGFVARGAYSSWGPMRWILDAFNQFDGDRVKEVGPDRAAAEWLIKNEASVKYVGIESVQSDYNLFPLIHHDELKVEKVFAEGSSIKSGKVNFDGFRHLEDLKHVTTFHAINCRFVNDQAIARLHYIRSSLVDLHIEKCPLVTSASFDHIRKLHHLKMLAMSGLSKTDVRSLEGSLPGCRVVAL